MTVQELKDYFTRKQEKAERRLAAIANKFPREGHKLDESTFLLLHDTEFTYPVAAQQVAMEALERIEAFESNFPGEDQKILTLLERWAVREALRGPGRVTTNLFSHALDVAHAQEMADAAMLIRHEAGVR